MDDESLIALLRSKVGDDADTLVALNELLDDAEKRSELLAQVRSSISAEDTESARENEADTAADAADAADAATDDSEGAADASDDTDFKSTIVSLLQTPVMKEVFKTLAEDPSAILSADGIAKISEKSKDIFQDPALLETVGAFLKKCNFLDPSMRKAAASMMKPSVIAALKKGDTSVLTPEMRSMYEDAASEEGRQRLLSKTMSAMLGQLAPNQRGMMEAMMKGGGLESMMSSRKARRAMQRASSKGGGGGGSGSGGGAARNGGTTKERLRAMVEERRKAREALTAATTSASAKE